MRDHYIMTTSSWSNISLLIFLVSLCNVVLSNNSFSASLQQPKLLCHNREKLALLQFKQSFVVNCSASSSTSARPKVNSWHDGTSHSTGDCCRWDGVKCNEETGHVIGLDLSSSCLYGTFPSNSSLFGLDHLLELNLADNYFNYSRIPSACGRLSKLKRLNLSQSAFSGQIPLGMSKLSSLSLLDLAFNVDLKLHYELSFEKLVRNLTRLTVLNLDYVDVSDVVPVSLSNLTSLKSLSLGYCNLYGEFPTDVLRLPKLEEVFLPVNRNLGGYLPEFLSNSPLQLLNLALTSFYGKLPSSIGKLGCLTELNLAETTVIGPIPSSLGNLTKLNLLCLSGLNDFKGDYLPSSIANLTQLTSLSLSYIQVEPQILNSWLFKLHNLETLALYNMDLRGEIPSVIGNLTGLDMLNLNSNLLTGPLPIWLTNLTDLIALYLSDNQLQGPIIPPWFSQLTNLETLFLSSNNGSTGMFDTLLKLPYLNTLGLFGVDLIFPPNSSTFSSLPKFGFLKLVSCNLTEFPEFLRYQDELQLLDLTENNIVGTIPQWFVNTTRESLLEITLDRNFLTGFEQPQVFLPWDNLQALSINSNKLQDVLLAPPISLQIYQVSENQLSGVIPKKICKASALTYLDLSHNNLSGRIPTCIGPDLGTSLQVLNLRGNNFHGTSPQAFTRACKLKMINLSGNQFEGQLPKSLANCTMLEVLDVGKNNFNDTFPSWLGSLHELQVLVLRHNSFHGSIATPKSGQYFRGLHIIDLSYNFHTGSLPTAYLQNWPAMRVTNENKHDSSSTEVDIYFSVMGASNVISETYTFGITITNKGRETSYSEILTVFRVIDFSSNNFTGRIPDVFGNLRGLQALNLSNNNLLGGIPYSLSNIIDLEALDLSQNMLSGEIPQQLTELTYLEVFDVSHNRLVGPIPQGKQFNTFDNSSFDWNLALCGVPLTKKCENIDSQQPPPPLVTDDEKQEDSKLIDWIIRSLGCASGCIVGYVIGKIYITDRHHDWFMKTFGRKRRPKPSARRSAPNRRRH